jgi:hypothetical protein
MPAFAITLPIGQSVRVRQRPITRFLIVIAIIAIVFGIMLLIAHFFGTGNGNDGGGGLILIGGFG